MEIDTPGGDAEDDEADRRRDDRADDAAGGDEPGASSLGSWPAFTIIGNSSADSAAASATAEPDSAARMHEATITT